MMRLTLPLLAATLGAMSLEAADTPLKTDAAQRFANLALACVHREYPNKISHALESDADVQPPRVLTPAFYGCYDWHSSVHGHWLLARLARLYPDAPFAKPARAALAQSLTPEHLQAEARYLNGTGRASFERPYGLAWLLQLAAELHEWNTPEAQTWAKAMQPVEQAAVSRLSLWLTKLPHPVRSGEHSNTAFGLGLMLDYAKQSKNQAFRSLLEEKTRQFYAKDQACPFAYEPSGEDFLSPCLAEADAMRRVLPAAEFAQWLSHFFPAPQSSWLTPAHSPDASDGKLAHLDGLNLSRAWMMEGIASRLEANHPWASRLRTSAQQHRDAGLQAVTGEHYEGGHWLGSFATYLTTRRGLQ